MFNRLSIRLKLVVLLTLSAAAALTVSSVITVVTTFLAQRDDSLRVLGQLAEISSENLRAAMAFHDQASATKLLSPLRANPHIRLALTLDEEGRPFGRFAAPAATAEVLRSYEEQALRLLATSRSDKAGAPVEEANFTTMAVARAIELDGRPVGWLAIVGDNDELRVKIVWHLAFHLILSLAIVALLLSVSMPLQQMFTRPIYDLLASMRRISESKDYTLRVSSTRQDEFAELFDGFNAMLAEIRDRDERLSHLATTDPLTGLANRRFALDALDTLVARARRRAEPLGVMVLDVDLFKAINDAHGHPAGDAVLKEVAAVVHHYARDYDVVARFGGEEFLVLCDNSDEVTTRGVAERIRRGIEQHEFRLDGQLLRVTVSIGFCAMMPSSQNGETLIALADAALYRAKQSGRNRVECEGGS